MNSPTAESSLFIIWSNGRHVEERIVADLEGRFELLRLYEIVWSPTHAVRNFRRFYADLPVRGVYHALAKGRGPFLAALVLDPLPHVVECDTSRGPRVVNAHFLEAKTQYRQWAGQLTIHCTETPFETRRDLTMLFGLDAPFPEGLSPQVRPEGPQRLTRNPVGAGGWTSEEELFEALGRSVSYVVTGSPGDGDPDGILHRPGVNLLTDDYLTLHAVLDAHPSLARPHGGPFKVRIGDRWVGVQLRALEDGFYDPVWAEQLLASREKDEAGRYRPAAEEDFAALVYDLHAHPTNQAPYDGAQLSAWASELEIPDWPCGASPESVRAWIEGWLRTRGYAAVEPKDPSVSYDASFVVAREASRSRAATALRRRLSWWTERILQAVGDSYWRARDQLLLRTPWIRPSHWSGLRGLKTMVKGLSRRPELFVLKRMVMLGRGMLFLGRSFRCPCCGWSLRGFAGEWGIFTANDDGYCPRCNAKARHRRLCLYLQHHMNLSEGNLRLLEVAPWWAISRRLKRAPNVRFIGLDLERRGPHVTVVGDAAWIPLASNSLDALLCIHTLEHVEEDRRAIREIHRVLRPGGWAIVSVPLRAEGPTKEDSTITDPEHREREFGERSHVRFYGWDIEERLVEAGLSVDVDRADQIPPATRRRYGLRDDENLFVCRKV